jgi:hypothetical protein
MGDLIAEVKRLSAVKAPATKKPDAKKLEPTVEIDGPKIQEPEESPNT